MSKKNRKQLVTPLSLALLLVAAGVGGRLLPDPSNLLALDRQQNDVGLTDQQLLTELLQSKSLTLDGSTSDQLQLVRLLEGDGLLQPLNLDGLGAKEHGNKQPGQLLKPLLVNHSLSEPLPLQGKPLSSQTQLAPGTKLLRLNLGGKDRLLLVRLLPENL